MPKATRRVDDAFLKQFDEVLEQAAILADLLQREVESLRSEGDRASGKAKAKSRSKR